MHTHATQTVAIQARDIVYLIIMTTIVMLLANIVGTVEISGNSIITLSNKAIGLFSANQSYLALSSTPLSLKFIPMVWAVLLGITWGVMMQRFPQWETINIRQQFLSSQVMNIALLLFLATLAMNIGVNLNEVKKAGWALVFQEIGHFAGTILFGLPIALLLGIKREAVGATFSVGREPNLAIIGEKYGMDSPEGRGVLAEYITGTILGTLFITIFASFIASLGWFDYRALAMGAGVGSGSMMAAGAAAIKAQFPIELEKEILAIAASSNLLTIITGTYITLFLSLPAANWLYKHFEPILGRFSKKEVVVNKIEMVTPLWFPISFPILFLLWVLLALLYSFSFWLAQPDASAQYALLTRLPLGLCILLGVVLIGYLLSALLRKKIPAVCTVSLVGLYITSPWFPYHAWVREAGQDVMNIQFFVASTTVVLALAGLSIAKDIAAFRKLGWRIIVVSLCATAGTFLGATIVGQLFH